MGKRYDWQVTPQNTPRFKERRILFLTAMGIFVLNLTLAGVFLSENIAGCLFVALGVALFAGVQCFDNRRDMWTWGYVLFGIVSVLVASGILFLWYKAYWWLIGYGIELSAFIALAIWMLKKKTVKPRKS